MLKVALVGAGGISGAHIPAWDQMKETHLAALCDIRPECLEKYPDKHPEAKSPQECLSQSFYRKEDSILPVRGSSTIPVCSHYHGCPGP